MEKKVPNIDHADFANLLLESMADGVFTIDEKGRITSWNPSMEIISGYTAEEAIGKTCSMLGFDRCLDRACPAGIRECGIFEKGHIDGKECFLRHQSGHYIPVAKSARVIRDKNGRIRGVVETVTDLTELHKARQAAEEAHRKLGTLHQFDKLIGKSGIMQKIFSSIKKAASSDAVVLIHGESGTGKDLAAGAVHYNSKRSVGPFITVNCSALAESLLESELFGHVKGAFTGAFDNRVGRFEEADGGTLFLDEIGEISPFIQVKLLRVIQEREIERVGESTKRKIDIRIITATNSDLLNLVQAGRFRKDLYYRLKVFPIYMPPLRERKEDIVYLVAHFIDDQSGKTGKAVKGVTPSAMRLLFDYDWPGNVRELENAIEHAFVLCGNEHIDVFDLPVEIRRMDYRPPNRSLPLHGERAGFSSKKLTRELLLHVLEDGLWNKAEAARRVGLSRASIWKYMKKWDIPLKKPE